MKYLFKWIIKSSKKLATHHVFTDLIIVIIGVLTAFYIQDFHNTITTRNNNQIIYHQFIEEFAGNINVYEMNNIFFKLSLDETEKNLILMDSLLLNRTLSYAEIFEQTSEKYSLSKLDPGYIHNLSSKEILVGSNFFSTFPDTKTVMEINNICMHTSLVIRESEKLKNELNLSFIPSKDFFLSGKATWDDIYNLRIVIENNHRVLRRLIKVNEQYFNSIEEKIPIIIDGYFYNLNFKPKDKREMYAEFKRIRFRNLDSVKL